ncbi:hypothetical protein GCM10011572_53580 [Pseudoduganella buxea]|uniref:Uncharacterized protein n=1 Tax=Pseudoduganella buxea TaxID=1949069 RepID=A0ABQ1LJD9_9BURK|nr:hypothetical protein GCM10011572_53580 [Pseudoduganella buxea]
MVVDLRWLITFAEAFETLIPGADGSAQGRLMWRDLNDVEKAERSRNPMLGYADARRELEGICHGLENL